MRTSTSIWSRASDIPEFVEQKRAEGFAIDVKLLLFLTSSAPSSRSLGGYRPFVERSGLRQVQPRSL